MVEDCAGVDIEEKHYGKNADVLIKKLYWKRKGDLEKAGICISLEKLLNIYGFI